MSLFRRKKKKEADVPDAEISGVELLDAAGADNAGTEVPENSDVPEAAPELPDVPQKAERKRFGLFRKKKKEADVPQTEITEAELPDAAGADNAGTEVSETSDVPEVAPELLDVPQNDQHGGFLDFCSIWIGSIFAPEILTINIESTDIRFMLTRGRRVKKWGSFPLDSGIVREGQIIDHDAFCTALDEMVSANHLKKKKTIVSLSGTQTVNRIIELPKMPAKFLPDAIMTEAQRVMPVSLDQIYLSWHAFGGGRKDELQKFFLLGTPQNVMDEQMRCLQQSGISPRLVHLKPIALAQMVNLPRALIIDIESESCTIIVVVGGIPAIMRSIAMNPQHNPSEKARNVLQEFERTLRFYESSYHDSSIDQSTPLFLTGELAENEELYQAISAGTGHTVEPLGSSLRRPKDFPLEKFAVNIGLANRGRNLALQRSAEDGRFLITGFNILPDVYRPKGLPKKHIAFVFGIMAGVALVVPLYNMTADASDELSQLKSENDVLEQRVLMRQVQNKQAQEIRDAIAAATASLESTGQARSEVADYLSGIESRRLQAYTALYASTVLLKPDGVSLGSISQSDGEMNMAGQATDYQTALDYGYALRKSQKTFSDVQLHVMNASGGEGEELPFNDAYVVRRGGTLVVPAPGVLENDVDEDGNRLAAIKVSDPEFGSLTLNRDGSFTYVHSGLAEPFDSFTYAASDVVRASETVVNIIIDTGGVNYSAPVAYGDSYGGGVRGSGQEGESPDETNEETLDVSFTISLKWGEQEAE